MIGNHDLGYGDSGVQAQVDRTTANTSDDDGVWSMPSTNYTFKMDIPGSAGYVQVVAVDTTWLAPSENEATDERSTNTKLARMKSQLSNLYGIFEETLQTPRPTWLLVAGHYPIHSHGEKGDNEELIEYLQPFLQHYGVHAYLCGHDHINEHLRNNFSDVEYYVAGASSMTNTIDEDSESVSTLNWAGESTAAFTRFTATVETLTVDYIDVNNTIIYRYIQTNANPTPTAVPTYRPSEARHLRPHQRLVAHATASQPSRRRWASATRTPTYAPHISSSAHNDTANSTTTSQMSSSDSTLLGVFLGLALSIIFAMLCVFYDRRKRQEIGPLRRPGHYQHQGSYYVRSE